MPRPKSLSPTKIYTDGSHQEICYVLGSQSPVRQPVKTNGCAVTGNEAEYRACLVALQAAKNQGIRRVEILSDSQVMIRQLNGEYAARSPRLNDLRILVLSLASEFDEVRFTWVRREQNPAGRELERKSKGG
jgi:ribonuclease HI